MSRILKMEPEGVVFDEPVTVLLSHSLYEDQDFLDFYELVIENVGPTGLQDLKTERISSIEGMDSKLIMIIYEIKLIKIMWVLLAHGRSIVGSDQGYQFSRLVLPS